MDRLRKVGSQICIGVCVSVEDILPPPVTDDHLQQDRKLGGNPKF